MKIPAAQHADRSSHSIDWSQGQVTRGAGVAATIAALVRRQCRSLKGSPAEADVLSLTEEAAARIEGWK
jgi:hypothetical protein